MSADAVLVHRCLTGDAAATRELVERFAPDVAALCQRILRHRQDAEDVTQEVFLRVFRSLGKWDASRPLRPWVLGIAVNRCRTALSTRARRPATADFLQETPDHRPEDDSRDAVREIRVAVDALRDEYREVFILFHEQGQSYEEIALVVERPVGTVKTWLHRGRLLVLDHLRSVGLMPKDETQGDERRARHEHQ